MLDSNSIIEMARGIIVDREVRPMLFISFKDERGEEAEAVCDFAVPSEYKFEAMYQIGQKFSEYECDAIAMITEAWVSKVDVRNYSKEEIKKLKASEDPNRSEALIYVQATQEGISMMRIWDIERGADGPVLTEKEPKNVVADPLLAIFWKGYKENRIESLRRKIREIKN